MSEKEYLLLLTRKRSVKPLVEKFHELKGFYNGLGYVFPKENRPLLHDLVKHLPDIEILSVPLPVGQTFETLKQSYKTSFFRDRLYDIDTSLFNIKIKYSLEEISEDYIQNNDLPFHIKEEILLLFQEKERLKKALEWAEGIEKALTQDKISSLAVEIKKRSSRTYEIFEKEHKEKIASGGFISGYESIDNNIFFSSGDLNIIQAMSNHGKTTFMLNLCYKFLTQPINLSKKPLCVFITYESSSLRIEEKILNIISSYLQNERIIKFNNESTKDKTSIGNYFYPNPQDFKVCIDLFNALIQQETFLILERTPIERFSELISELKERHPDKKIIFFLDYIQIVKNDLKSDGWEKIKDLAYWLEEFTIQNNIITFAGSQVNEKRETREGKDIYNAATNVIDIFNNSHAKLQNHSELKNKYKEKINGKSIITITGDKAKNFSSFYLENCLLFDGFKFEEYNENKSTAPSITKNSLKKQFWN